MNIFLQVMKEAAEMIKRCDYTPARSLLLKAIEEMEKAEPVAQVTSFGCQPLRQFDVHEWGTPLYLHPSLAIPEGWLLVPKEPTFEMLAAADNTTIKRLTYKAMLAAAPEYKP